MTMTRNDSRGWMGWAVWLIVYAVAFVSLDWLSQRFTDQTAAASSWNPAVALPFIAILLQGRKVIPFVFAVAVASSLIMRLEIETPTLAIVDGFMTVGIHCVAAIVVASRRFGFDARLTAPRDLVILLAAAVMSSATAAVVNGLVLVAGAGLSIAALLKPTLRYWVGDLIGIAIIAPLGLLVLQKQLTFRPTRLEILQYVITAGLLAVAFAAREAGRFPYFYFLFFPVIWIALTSGLEGAVAVLALIQVGMVGVVLFTRLDFLDVADFQARMLALAATGLIAGSLVSAQRRSEERYRSQQSALAQVATRGSLVELGTAIAHEVNQPLSAASTYASLVVETLALERLSDPTALVNARNVVRQIDRASSVVRKVRALVRPAEDDAAPVAPEQIIREVLELVESDASAQNIDVRTDIGPHLPALFVDRLQVEQAMINLTRNAIEAIRDLGTAQGNVSLYAREVLNGAVELGVIDNGPGFPAGFNLDNLQPFKSAKRDGLGVGLSLCQTVAMANGGRLVIHPSDNGAHIALVFETHRGQSDG